MSKVITYRNDMPFIKTLIEKDPLLLSLFQSIEAVTLTLSDDYFLSLIESIISQQLSSRVATVIYDRLLSYYDHDVTPKKILSTDKEELRALGISYAKINYLQSLANTVDLGLIAFDQFEHMSDEHIIDELVQVKGIGEWTAQMFLMFSLGREDVSAPLDLGLRKAYSRLKREEVDIKTFEKSSKAWQPYRSIVSYFLWKSIDKPKEV